MIRLCIKNSLFSASSSITACLNNETSSTLSIIGINRISNLSRHFATKNDIETKSERIYYGNLTPQIKAVKVFSLTSSMAGLFCQPIIMKQAHSIGSPSLMVAICSVVGFFTFITPVLLHFITKKYVTEIDYEPETSTYKAITINFFLAEKQLSFKAEDVEVPDIPGMFTTMKAKGVPLFIEARHFTNPLHYAKIMGYDKPMDFKLGTHTEEDDKIK